MISIYKYSLKQSLGQILGWGIAFGLTAYYLMILYEPMASQNTSLQELLEAYGETMMAFLGGNINIALPANYLDFSFFSYIPVAAGIFAIIAGSGLLVADEEKGTLDLIMAYPVTRSQLFWGRLLAFITSNFLILCITWLGFISGIPAAGWDTSIIELALPHLSLLFLLLLYGTLALILSLILPSRRIASSISAGIVLISYFVASLSNINDNLESIAQFLPMHYYQGASALNGINWNQILVLFSVSLLFVLLAWWKFLRRDIRVSGEGSWRIGTKLNKES